MNIKKAFLIFTGTVCVGLGVLGMFLPLLPTTVFLLLGAYCYSRGSERFHQWLLNNRLCGKYISNYKSGRGMTVGQKVSTLLTLWGSIGLSIWLFSGRFWPTLMLTAVAVGVTAHILWIKTRLSDKSERNAISARLAPVLLLFIALTSAACGGETATSTNSPPTQGNADEILVRMTEKLKSSPAITFSTVETADRLKRGGEISKINVSREVVFRSPDRMYFKVTGDRDLEAFYDGKTVTLVTHKDKVWAQLPAPATLAETIDKVSESYGMPMPVADLFGLDPKGKLRNSANTASIEKKETIAGVECNVIAVKNADVEWEVWIPVSGDPLPQKLHAKYKTAKGQQELTYEFSKWNLTPQITDDIFVAKVPDDYEGIPIIQRASAVIPRLEEAEKKAASNTNAAVPVEANKQ